MDKESESPVVLIDLELLNTTRKLAELTYKIAGELLASDNLQQWQRERLANLRLIVGKFLQGGYLDS